MIKKVAYGIYILPDYIEDEFYINYLKNKDLIYTNSSALYLHGLTHKQLDTYQVNFFAIIFSIFTKTILNISLNNKTIYRIDY